MKRCFFRVRGGGQCTFAMEFVTGDDEHNCRLDAALASLLPDYSRTVLKGCISGGKVSVDGTVVTKASFRVSSGQHVSLELPERVAVKALPQDLPLEIVYQDADIAVINKGAGMVVHPGAGVPDGTLMNAMLCHFPQTAALPRAGIVHRLDRDTSGLMVTALSQAACTGLTAAIAAHRVLREYEALAEGLIISGGTIETFIGRDPCNRTRMAVMPEGIGREAVTHYRVMERFRAHTLLKLRLETGRTHQIRVHMASIGHPLLGDRQYGSSSTRLLPKAPEQLNAAMRSFRHQALHASHLEFVHPVSGQALSFDAPAPRDFHQLVELLREDLKQHGED